MEEDLHHLEKPACEIIAFLKKIHTTLSAVFEVPHCMFFVINPGYAVLPAPVSAELPVLQIIQNLGVRLHSLLVALERAST